MPYLGETVKFKVTWTDYAGDAIDPDSQEAKLYDGNGDLVATITSSQMVKEETGVYSFDYTLPSSSASGTWKIVWTGTKDGNSFIVSKMFSVSEV